MGKLHHATLKMALATFSVLLAEGKTETEIKDAISKHEKGFSNDEINEIYDNIVNPPAPPAPPAPSFKYIVTKAFRDKDDFSNEIEVGTDVSDYDAERLAHLVAIKHVEKEEAE